MIGSILNVLGFEITKDTNIYSADIKNDNDGM